MPAVPRSLPRLCVALGFPSVAELAQVAEQEYKDGSSFLEFRLDYLKDPCTGLDLIRKFRSAHPDTHILATCRHRHAHGQFSGSIPKQVSILEESAAAGATFVDLEIESAEQLRSEAESLRRKALLVTSYHNFRHTPNVEAIMRRLSKVPSDVYKVATTARKQSDNLRILNLARAGGSTPLVAFAMSDLGTASRVLTPSLGCLFTFAAPSAKPGTAPGQISARALRSLYRPEKLGKQTRVYGIIADPVSHTKSPFIQNRAFQARRFDGVYLPFLVASRSLGDWMRFAGQLPVHGFSVTIPHKLKILRYLDTVEPLARRIGAVNTVWKKGGKWRGTNTDTEGVVKPLARHLRLANSHVLVAGYGGAARAAAFALSDARAAVTITGRDLAKATALARAVKGDAVSIKQAQTAGFDALVHATPVGMTPHSEGCLFSDRIPSGLVLDMVYDPHETELLKRAKESGATIIPGVEMLLEQAAGQFEIWTGEAAPRDVMRSSLEQHF